MGKLLSVWRIISDCPNQPDLPRQLKTRTDFSMVPILDTNLCYRPISITKRDPNPIRHLRMISIIGTLKVKYLYYTHKLPIDIYSVYMLSKKG